MRAQQVLLVVVCLHAPDLLVSTSERCDDWGVDTMKHKPVYSGEPAKIKCPLFVAFVKYNYSTAHSAGLTLIWYWIGQGQDLEEPINFRHPDNHISKEKDMLWFRPALLNDTGNYTCMLRNATYCSKIAVPLEVVHKDPGSCLSQAVKPEEVLMYYDRVKWNLTCPDVESFIPAGLEPQVRWYKECHLMKYEYHDRIPNGLNLTFGIVLATYEGEYTCVASYRENSRDFSLTRTMRVRVVGAPEKSTPPVIISPTKRIAYELKPGEQLRLPCEVTFTFLKDSPQEVWWAIDGKHSDDVTDFKFNVSTTETPLTIGGTKIEKRLIVPRVTEKDLKRNFTCFAQNNRGIVHAQAVVRMKPPVLRYTVELACGLGATVLLVVILTVIYHFYWLEMVLFYRAHFGTDETVLDGKEYDIYVSYARNMEEEDFVLLTLRGVLENEYGYKLCIFDRDSLPGGNITEAIFDFIQKSRKMIVVLSPDYLLEKSISLLEFKLGLLCQNNIATKLVVVEYQPLPRAHPSVQQLKESVAFVVWKGEKSKHLGSKFWKALRLALPLQSLGTCGNTVWNESCSSHSDTSLEQAQKKRSRLKGPPPKAKGVPVQRGLASLPRRKTKQSPKPFLACRCCVASSNEKRQFKSPGQAAAKPKQEMPCQRPLLGDSAVVHLQKNGKKHPLEPQVAALGLQQFADVSNNNDFYVL
ncbi:interleukin-1 receptor accessory protein isoform X1 [Ahaetulla prasina]|nr:interleukin-1 receptor accessory protein isoform X1 [Ahaetulla prasina]XP_058044906.1 interleukin-1 receptor accessory protein isoform X1 [Ahaetulla prasina]XP_058044908.1 interleukin-1 receptor accessory protein isoform X1 [Ahaetulla prasina]XP_058044909.1 interleukin-1 receptor accessory protein isoform X1 [Ahaetulla prasina]XP_058044910.1 interleukin-1 receptor accessory protein isoform X1 [Ahaetulla prasina]XP_058044911.1 interleukin-1 receptor accessory protein isoform X1 [Ahaetulla pr